MGFFVSSFHHPQVRTAQLAWEHTCEMMQNGNRAWEHQLAEENSACEGYGEIRLLATMLQGIIDYILKRETFLH